MQNKSHQLDPKEMGQFTKDAKFSDRAVAFTSGPVRKELTLRTNMQTLQARWIVFRAGKVVKTTKSLTAAVKAYNAI